MQPFCDGAMSAFQNVCLPLVLYTMTTSSSVSSALLKNLAKVRARIHLRPCIYCRADLERPHKFSPRTLKDSLKDLVRIWPDFETHLVKILPLSCTILQRFSADLPRLLRQQARNLLWLHIRALPDSCMFLTRQNIRALQDSCRQHASSQLHVLVKFLADTYKIHVGKEATLQKGYNYNYN